MRSINDWLEAYGADHQNPKNKKIHWVCVPLIVWSLMAILWSIPFPSQLQQFSYPINWAIVAFVLGSVYYFTLSWRLAIGLFVLNLIFLVTCHLAHQFLPWPLWITAVGVFILAWIGQFIGHNIEGRRPSFFADLQFLMIGPAWVVAFLYQKLGLRIS